MSPSYAPIQHEDIPAGASGVIYRISYGVQYGELVDPQFVYKVQLIDHGQVEGEAGLCLPDQRDVAVRVAQAISRFIARPHPL
ncbi:hypothetical protein AB4099_34365 [Bosea sp. 2KB_26]|uniref:hypothetical protein n=1 Tax=Bosea sp. 2KB_26 TaxID=3237475 RepID=UPI003F8F40D7